MEFFSVLVGKEELSTRASPCPYFPDKSGHALGSSFATLLDATSCSINEHPVRQAVNTIAMNIVCFIVRAFSNTLVFNGPATVCFWPIVLKNSILFLASHPAEFLFQFVF